MTTPFNLLLSCKDLQREFSTLMKEASRLSIIAAWATPGFLLDLLGRSSIATECFIGTNFSSTTPEALETLSSYGPLYVDERTDRVFHPKVYLFRVGSKYELIVGSPNLTDSAFRRNYEIAVRMTLKDASAQFLLDHLNMLRKTLRRVDAAWLETYRRRYKPPTGNMGARLRVEAPQRGQAKTKPSLKVLGTLLREDWGKYAETVKRRSLMTHKRDVLFDPKYSYLEALDRLVPIIKQPFDRLGKVEFRKLIGGKVEGFDYGWFGSLTANGRGVHELMTNGRLRRGVALLLPKVLAAKSNDDVLKSARLLYDHLARVPGLKHAAPTRLLAVARPDRFFSVMGPSVRRLADTFGMSQARLKRWEGYAEALKMVWESKWYRSPEPRDPKEARMWNARVALLDAYAYEGDHWE